MRGRDPGPLAFVCEFPLPTSQWQLWSSGSDNHTFVPWALEAECLQCHPRGSSSRALQEAPVRLQAQKGRPGLAGSTDRFRNQPGTPGVGPRDSACRLEFHLGHVACQMVSRNCVTRSQRSTPTRPHGGPENGGCRAGRNVADWLGTGWGLTLLWWRWALGGFWPLLSPAFPTPIPSLLLLQAIIFDLSATDSPNLRPGESHLVPWSTTKLSLEKFLYEDVLNE